MSNPKYDQRTVMSLLGTVSNHNRARQVFSAWCGKIEQAGQQRTPLSPVTLRAMEFEAVEAILKVYGVEP